jgi:hypothetical protein
MNRLLTLSLLIAGLAPAQEKTAIQTSGEEVLVDVVVRDKKRHAVTNLPQGSFTVLDEGVPAAMDAPDSNGRIQYVANAPIDQFDPGNYAVRFIVRQGAEVAEEDLSIKLEP